MPVRHRALRIAFIILAVVTLGIGPTVGAQPPLDDPPDPQPLPRTGIPWLDAIYYGAVPPHAQDGPVLVFVHGYGGVAENWWASAPCGEQNDMYAMAYQAGYRTAFVNLGGSNGRSTGSMWDNGQMLGRQLRAIAETYGVNTLDIVAHSKGGLDAQAADVYYSRTGLVRNVFTLGTPHQGSELADLLYTEPVKWLARLAGLQNDATYTLQTGYMRIFRALTDPKIQNGEATYYTAAGTDTGPLLSPLALTGLYLSNFGPNDGVVTVASTELAGARTLFIQRYHHYNVFLGSTAFPWIDAALQEPSPPITYSLYLPSIALDSRPLASASSRSVITAQPLLSADYLSGKADEHRAHRIRFSASYPLEARPTAEQLRNVSEKSSHPAIQPSFGSAQDRSNPLPSDVEGMGGIESDFILRGGRVSGPVTQTVTIEPGALSATFNLFVSDETITATLTGPDGLVHSFESTSGCGGFLTGIPYQAYAASEPPAGLWTMNLDGPTDAAYLLIVVVESPLQVTLHGVPGEPVMPGSPLKLSARVDDPSGQAWVHGLEAYVTRSWPDKASARVVEVYQDFRSLGDPSTSSGQAFGSLVPPVPLPTEEGIYVISGTVTGETAAGMPFERSFAASFAVARPETLRAGPTLLDK